MRLSEILTVDCVSIPLEASDKHEAIKKLLDVLHNSKAFEDYDRVLQAVMERESIRSTGIGQGFAIPHGKCASVPRLVMAVGKLPKPIDFQSIDGKPVSLIILIVSPADQTGPHIQALARISRILTEDSIRSKLEKAQTAQAFHKLLCDYDQANPA